MDLSGHPGHCCTLWQLEEDCAPSLLLLHAQDLRAPLSAHTRVTAQKGEGEGNPSTAVGRGSWNWELGLGCCAADKSSPQKAAEPLARHFGRVWCQRCEK